MRHVLHVDPALALFDTRQVLTDSFVMGEMVTWHQGSLRQREIVLDALRVLSSGLIESDKLTPLFTTSNFLE